MAAESVRPAAPLRRERSPTFPAGSALPKNPVCGVVAPAGPLDPAKRAPPAPSGTTALTVPTSDPATGPNQATSPVAPLTLVSHGRAEPAGASAIPLDPPTNTLPVASTASVVAAPRPDSPSGRVHTGCPSLDNFWSSGGVSPGGMLIWLPSAGTAVTGVERT